MKKCIVLLFLIICFTTGLRAAESTSPKDYLKKENYEIIEIESMRDAPSYPKRIPLSESGQVLTQSGLFDPKTKNFAHLPNRSSTESVFMADINDKNQVCGSSGGSGFLWHVTTGEIEYFQGFNFGRIFNDGSCLASNGFCIDSEGNIKKSQGSYIYNKTGQCPTDQFVQNIIRTLGNNNTSIQEIGYNAQKQLLFYLYIRPPNGQLGSYLYLAHIANAAGEIQQLKRPRGMGSDTLANYINDFGVVAGSICKITDGQKTGRVACLWHENDIYILNDIFNENYLEVSAINNRGDMVVIKYPDPTKRDSTYKLLLFLKKNSQKPKSLKQRKQIHSKSAEEKRNVHSPLSNSKTDHHKKVLS